jgi:hypothetical protein
MLPTLSSPDEYRALQMYGVSLDPKPCLVSQFEQ